MPKVSRVPSSLLALTLAACSFLPAIAHTLPVGYLNAVPAADYLHLELELGLADLQFVSELDHNNNGRIEPGEFDPNHVLIARRILDCLEIRLDGIVVAADTAGAMLDPNSEHLTVRAHYPGNALQARVSIQSRLPTILNGAHHTQVRFGADEHRQVAQLNVSNRLAAFAPLDETASGAAGQPPTPAQLPRPVLQPRLGFVALLSVLLLVALPATAAFGLILLLALRQRHH